MAHTTNDLPIVHLLYQTYKRWNQLINKFPKSERYTLGQTCQQLLLMILKQTLAASTTTKAEQKLNHLRQATIDLDTLKLLIRLCKDCECIDNNAYLQIEGFLHQAGKMIGGWQKSISTQNKSH